MMKFKKIFEARNVLGPAEGMAHEILMSHEFHHEPAKTKQLDFTGLPLDEWSTPHTYVHTVEGDHTVHGEHPKKEAVLRDLKAVGWKQDDSSQWSHTIAFRHPDSSHMLTLADVSAIEHTHLLAQFIHTGGDR